MSLELIALAIAGLFVALLLYGAVSDLRRWGQRRRAKRATEVWAKETDWLWPQWKDGTDD